jgi:hypothetical protein
MPESDHKTLDLQYKQLHLLLALVKAGPLHDPVINISCLYNFM